MSPFVIFPYYLAWHYTRAIRDFFTIWGNLLWFVLQFFSISLLFKTLFAPFKRLKEAGAKDAIDVEGFFEALIVNTIMRIVGFIFRSIIIIFGLLFYILTFILGIASFLMWIALPFIIIFLLFSSFIGFLKL